MFNTGATKSNLSRKCYDHNPHLHSLPKFKSYSKYLVVGNGQPVVYEFVIPLIIMIKEHVFEIHIIVCDMTDSISLVWVFRNIIETEGVVCTHTMSYKVLNRSPYLSPMEPFSLWPGECKTIKLKAKFSEEITGHAIIKMMTNVTPATLKVQVVKNIIMMNVQNKSSGEISATKDSLMGILDVRSLGYFHVSIEQLKSTMLSEYKFDTLHHICNTYNRLIADVNESTKPF